MQYSEEDSNSRLKLVQLWHVIKYTIDNRNEVEALKPIISEILKDDVDINCKVTVDPKTRSDKVHLKDCTALHLAYCGSRDINIFNNFLERQVDFTLKNGNGQTVLHLIVTNSLSFHFEDHIPFVNCVLSAHVRYGNGANPRDNDGISHLHAACVANHVDALELFLTSGASVDEAVNVDSRTFAGYTPLHFAVKCNNFEAARMLSNYGANINAKDAKGMTPLDLTMECRLDKLNATNDLYVEQYDVTAVSSKDWLLNNEKILKLLLENPRLSATTSWSRLHVACTLEDLSITKNLLNQSDDVSSLLEVKASFPPGFTALHFAAFNSTEAVKTLLKYGAKLDTEDANGLTPFNICIQHYGTREIHETLCCIDTWNEICLSDGENKLLDFVRVTAELDQFQSFLKKDVKELVVPGDSPSLLNCTILHLAVTFSTCTHFRDDDRKKPHYEESIVNECLDIGLDVNALNAKNQTAVHLAFIQGKKNIVKLLLGRLNRLDEVANLVDEDNLSYLHIACAVKHESLVEKLSRICDVNVAYKGTRTLKHLVPGSTPLHVAATNKASAIAETLLRRGADLHATDDNGLAPIHCLLRHLVLGYRDRFGPKAQATSDVLFDSLSQGPKDVEVEGIDLSYLHVASYFGNEEAVETLLELGSNVNAIISYEKLGKPLSHVLNFSSCSPLHLGQVCPDDRTIRSLLRRGADVFAKVSDPSSELYYYDALLANEVVVRNFVAVLLDQEEMQKIMEVKWGLTKLHVACHMKNEEAIKCLLDEGADVNVPVKANAEIFAGCTPLHLLVSVSVHDVDDDQYEQSFAVDAMINLLVGRGADVAIENSEGDTPVHVFSKYREYFTDADRCVDSLLNAHRDFSVNPVGVQGISHFHLACQCHKVEIVEKFLRHGCVDANRPTDLFVGNSTPLHLALDYWVWSESSDEWAKLEETVDLLLEYGANLAAKDVLGDTPLHKSAVLNSPGMSILDKLLSHGADIKSKNVKGDTCLDQWLITSKVDYMKVLEKYNYQINSWNSLTGEGYITDKIICELSCIDEFEDFFEEATKWSDVKALDEFGRTVIHNSVAKISTNKIGLDEYVYPIGSFIRRGVHVDHQDQSGQTALHYAARLGNDPGVKALLAHGADINILDNSGKSAFCYDAERAGKNLDKRLTYMTYATAAFNLHVKKLQYLKLEVSQLNQNLVCVLKKYTVDGEEQDNYFFNPLHVNNRQITFDEDSCNILQAFTSQVERTKTLSVGKSSLTVFHFLHETGATTLYPYMSSSERTVIDDFFNSDACNEFDKLIGLIKLQFGKMKAKLELIDPALTALRELLCFSVPGMCEEITRYLMNSDLKNVIASIENEI